LVKFNSAFTRGASVSMVIEAKDAGDYSPQKAVKELQEAQDNREAAVGIMVFEPGQYPGVCYPLEQYGDDKIICGYDPSDEYDICLQLA